LLNPVQQARYLMYLEKLSKEARNIKGGVRGNNALYPLAPEILVSPAAPGLPG
jgi:hypothetical protein